MRQQININVLKPHPRNNEFFDDLSGEEFERLKNSIRDVLSKYLSSQTGNKPMIISVLQEI